MCEQNAVVHVRMLESEDDCSYATTFHFGIPCFIAPKKCVVPWMNSVLLPYTAAEGNSHVE